MAFLMSGVLLHLYMLNKLVMAKPCFCHTAATYFLLCYCTSCQKSLKCWLLSSENYAVENKNAEKPILCKSVKLLCPWIFSIQSAKLLCLLICGHSPVQSVKLLCLSLTLYDRKMRGASHCKSDLPSLGVQPKIMCQA